MNMQSGSPGKSGRKEIMTVGEAERIFENDESVCILVFQMNSIILNYYFYIDDGLNGVSQDFFFQES